MIRDATYNATRSLRLKVFGVALFVAAGFLGAPPATATIRYTISVAQPEQHTFRVTMTVPDVRGELVVQLPAWNGLYQIRDFAYHVADVRAADGAGKSLPVWKLDKQTWRIAGQETVTIGYSTYWDEPGPFSSQLNATHAFVNLATILFYVPDRRREDTRVQFQDLPPEWRVAVALRSDATSTSNHGPEYIAASYDVLVDAPVELGTFEELRLEAGGRPIRIVMHGGGWDRQQLTDMVRRIVDYETRLMGGAPFEEYLLIYHVGSVAMGVGGGMEHANSTAIFSESAGRLAPVSAHEFFHLWNVKRIRPQSLEPVDYAREQWTRALWFAEGVTSTYASYTLLRSGLWDRRRFYEDLADQITELEARPARRWQSVEEASLDAWLEKYPMYRRPEFSVSYYNKGQLLGVLLDILMRDLTDNRASLDDLLRSLNKDFALRGRFYRDTADIQAQAQALMQTALASTAAAGSDGHGAQTESAATQAAARAGESLASGEIQRSLAELFSRYVAGTDEVPWGEFLARAGLLLKAHGRAFADFGFWAARTAGGEAQATQIIPGGAAEQAGLVEGDVLVALNGLPFPRQPERWLREHQPGETVRVRLRRGTEEREASFALSARPGRTFEIEEMPTPSPKQRRILEGILRGETERRGE